MMPAVGNPPVPNPPGPGNPRAQPPGGNPGNAGRARYDQVHHAQDPYADIPDARRDQAQRIANEAIQIDDFIKQFELAENAATQLQACINQLQNNPANFSAWFSAQRNDDFYITYKEHGQPSFQLFPAGDEAIRMFENRPRDFVAALMASQQVMTNWAPSYDLDLAIPRNINEARNRKTECHNNINNFDNLLHNQHIRKITRQMYDNESFRQAQQRQIETTVSHNIGPGMVAAFQQQARVIVG